MTVTDEMPHPHSSKRREHRTAAHLRGTFQISPPTAMDNSFQPVIRHRDLLPSRPTHLLGDYAKISAALPAAAPRRLHRPGAWAIREKVHGKAPDKAPTLCAGAVAEMRGGTNDATTILGPSRSSSPAVRGPRRSFESVARQGPASGRTVRAARPLLRQALDDASATGIARRRSHSAGAPAALGEDRSRDLRCLLRATAPACAPLDAICPLPPRADERG